MAEFEKFMGIYEGDLMERKPPVLSEGEKEHILVTHDESIFYSNDGSRGIWAKNGELPLRKMGNGKSIMVSEYLTESIGRLQIPQHQENLFEKMRRICEDIACN